MAIIEKTKELLAHGARLHWNVESNIKAVADRHPEKATLLRLVSRTMAGEEDPAVLDEVLARWSLGPSI